MSDIRNPKFLSVGDICRPVDSGKMLVQDCEVESPLPCIVILVHGVNDVGEAYQNQDEGICQGLNERLGRDDLHPHDWKAHEFMISDPDGNISATTCPQEKQTCIGVVNRSPTIPFYWGYKPVDKATWEPIALFLYDPAQFHAVNPATGMFTLRTGYCLKCADAD